MRMSGQVFAASANLSSVARLARPSSALANSKTIWPVVARLPSLSSHALARRSAALATGDGATAGRGAAESVLPSAGNAATVSGLPGVVASAPLGGVDPAGAGSGAGGGG